MRVIQELTWKMSAIEKENIRLEAENIRLVYQNRSHPFYWKVI